MTVKDVLMDENICILPSTPEIRLASLVFHPKGDDPCN